MSLNFDPNNPSTQQLNQRPLQAEKPAPEKRPSLPLPEFETPPTPEKKIKVENLATFSKEGVSPQPTADAASPILSRGHLRKHVPVAPTPHKPTHKGPQPNFPNLQPEVMDHTFSSKPSGLDLNRSYTQNGHTHTLMKQQSSKDCGAYALLMLFTDLMRKQISISFGEDLMRWVSRAYLLKADNLISKAKEHHVTIVKEKLPIASAINTVQKRIAESSYPVIVSISEPIGGHWIVVDNIKEKKVYIRDPFTGNAYAIPQETFLSYLDQGGIEQCLSVSKN